MSLFFPAIDFLLVLILDFKMNYVGFSTYYQVKAYKLFIYLFKFISKCHICQGSVISV